MDDLKQMNARLRRIFRGEESFGDGTAAEQSRRYRLTELLPVTVAAAKRNSTDVPRGPVDLLVSLSGFSPETTILACELLQPTRLMIIGSESTRASVDVIQQALQLPLSRLDVRYVDPTDPLKIYQFVQEAAHSTGSSRSQVIIDITGGKKVMSASAALAAAQLDLQLCYVDSRFDPELRQSEPGTERLVILPNPTALFGDRDLDAALVAFRHGAYAAAHDRFAEIADSAYEPARARFLRDLSDVYQAWCDLQFDGLEARLTALRNRLADPGYRPPKALVGQLTEQVRFLDELATLRNAEQEGPPLLLNFYLLGRHYERLGRQDFAALLYYRTIESGFVLRLGRRAPGFDPSKPDYTLLSEDPEQLAAQYAVIASTVHRRDVTGLPVTVGLIAAAELLLVLSDPMLDVLEVRTAKALGHLNGLVLARNRSVLAHGTNTVTAELSGKLQNYALRCLRAFWALEFSAESVDARIATLQFVTHV
jgi:CRISPR-associated protein (TIGR02710 family)